MLRPVVTRVLAAAVMALVVLTVAGCGASRGDGAGDRGATAAGATSAVGGAATVPPASPGPVTADGTSPVPAPTTGSAGDPADDTVPVAAPSSLSPVPVGIAAGTAGVTVTVTRIEAVQGQARGVGQVAGPAARVTVRIGNGTGAALSLGAVTVDLRTAAGESAPPLAGPGAAPLRGGLEPGAAATGTYVFELAAGERRTVTIAVTYAAGAPTVITTGTVG